MAYTLQNGASQQQIDEYCRDSYAPDEDVVQLDCGHWSLETQGHFIDAKTLVCPDCVESYAIRFPPAVGVDL